LAPKSRASGLRDEDVGTRERRCPRLSHIICAASPAGCVVPEVGSVRVVIFWQVPPRLCWEDPFGPLQSGIKVGHLLLDKQIQIAGHGYSGNASSRILHGSQCEDVGGPISCARALQAPHAVFNATAVSTLARAPSSRGDLADRTARSFAREICPETSLRHRRADGAVRASLPPIGLSFATRLLFASVPLLGRMVPSMRPSERRNAFGTDVEAAPVGDAIDFLQRPNDRLGWAA